jgi:hypothetical protein
MLPAGRLAFQELFRVHNFFSRHPPALQESSVSIHLVIGDCVSFESFSWGLSLFGWHQTSLVFRDLRLCRFSKGRPRGALQSFGPVTTYFDRPFQQHLELFPEHYRVSTA